SRSAERPLSSLHADASRPGGKRGGMLAQQPGEVQAIRAAAGPVGPLAAASPSGLEAPTADSLR
ncbi:hypothetical protein, partial [Streptomyces sp. NPDC057382]